MGNSGNNPPDPAPVPAKTPKVKRVNRNALIAEALDFRRQDASHREIAEVMGLNTQQVSELINEGLAQLIVEPEKLTAALELEQVREFIKGAYEAGIGGDIPAAEFVMKATKRKRELEEFLRPKLDVATEDDDAAFSPAALWELVDPEYRPQERPVIGTYKNGKPKYGPMPKPGKGRPAHKVTTQSLSTVYRMARANQTREDISAALCIDEKTFDKYYAQVAKVAPADLRTNVMSHLVTRMKKSDTILMKVAERLLPEFKPEPRWMARTDLGREGGTGADVAAQEKTINIRGGLPAPPAEWATPPGQVEALAAMGKNEDEFGEQKKATAPETTGVMRIAGQ